MRVFLLAMLTIGLIGCSPLETRTETTTPSRTKSAAEPFSQPKMDGIQSRRAPRPMPPSVEQVREPEPARSVAVDQELAALVAKYNDALDKYVRFCHKSLADALREIWKGGAKSDSGNDAVIRATLDSQKMIMQRGDLKLMESEIRHHPRFSDYKPSEEIIIKIKPKEMGTPWGDQASIEFRYYDLK